MVCEFGSRKPDGYDLGSVVHGGGEIVERGL
jgi:hypothetical protein